MVEVIKEKYSYCKVLGIREKIRLIIVLFLALSAFFIPFEDYYFKSTLSLAFIMWIFYIRRDDLKDLITNRIILLLILFFVSHAVTLFWSEHITEGLKELGQFLRYILIPIVLIITTVKKDESKYIVGAFILSMLINEILSYLIYFNLFQTEFSQKAGYPVPFINHIQYSVLAAFCSALILYKSQNINKKYLKVLYIIFFITMSTNLVISGGRTGYVAYFGSLIVLFFFYFKPSLKNFIQILVIPGVVFGLGYKFNDQVHERFNATANDLKELTDRRNHNTSIGARIAFYPITVDILAQPHNSFIWGIGIGDLKYELEKSTQRTNLIGEIYPHLHSSYLTAWVNGGFIGLLLLLLIFYTIFKINIEDKEMRFIKILFLTNFMIGIIPDILLTQKVTMVYFAVFIGIILTQHESAKIKIH